MAVHDSSPVRILAWAVPRTISTAFIKCLSSVDGMEVWFELFTGASFVRNEYEQQTGHEMPMEFEGNGEQVLEATKLFERFIGTRLVPERVVCGNLQKELQASSSMYIFAKEGCIAFPDKRSRKYLLPGFKHVFLIRNPVAVFTSYRKCAYQQLTRVGIRTGDSEDEDEFDMEYDNPVINPSRFFTEIVEMFHYVRDNLDPDPIVINTDDLLANPAEVLKKFCHLSRLPYSDSLLQWDASNDIINNWKTTNDKYIKTSAFYEAAVASDRFLPPKTAIPFEKLTPDARRLAIQSMPYFEVINQYKI
nr:uncharacterized protein LOC129255744 [Lytechinus pictus]